jgi:hypothetical protein
VGWRATKFRELFTESVGDVIPLIIVKPLEDDLANLLEMLLGIKTISVQFRGYLMYV